MTDIVEQVDRDHPDRREDRCDRCGNRNPGSWWVDSDRWRVACLAYGGTMQEMAENPFLCPGCFIALWEQVTGLTAFWHLVPGHIRANSSDKWFAEHNPGWTPPQPGDPE